MVKVVSPESCPRLPCDDFSRRKFSKGEPIRRSKLMIGLMSKSKQTSILSILTGTARAIPRHSKNSPEGLWKSLSVGSRGMLPTKVSARNSDMMHASAVGS